VDASVPGFLVGDFVCVPVGKKNYAGKVEAVDAFRDFKDGKGAVQVDYICRYWLDNKGTSKLACLRKKEVSILPEEDVPDFFHNRGRNAKKPN